MTTFCLLVICSEYQHAFILGKFRWEISKKEPLFGTWRQNQPDNAGGNENCVHYHEVVENEWQWNDHKCTTKFQALCQYSRGKGTLIKESNIHNA